MEAAWAFLMWSVATSGCGDSSFQGHSDWMLRQLRAGDIVPDDAVAAAAAEAAAANRQCKAEADTAGSRRRKAEAAEKFRQVCKKRRTPATDGDKP